MGVPSRITNHYYQRTVKIDRCLTDEIVGNVLHETCFEARLQLILFQNAILLEITSSRSSELFPSLEKSEA